MEQRVPAEVRVITDVDTLKVFADPLRYRILMETEEVPRTAKQLAAALGVPVTRLYYHLKVLERHDLIRVAERRMVSGIEERSYRATASSWNVSPDMQRELVESGVLGAMFDMARAQLEIALQTPGPPMGEPGSAVQALSMTRFYLTPDQVAEVRRRMEGLMLEFGSAKPDDPDAVEYGGVLALYKSPDAQR